MADGAKEFFVEEYRALRQEIRDREIGQGRVAASGVALLGGFIGVLVALKIDGDQSLISVLLGGGAHGTARRLFAVMCLGLVLGLDLLIAYWAFQVQMMFRIDRYLKLQRIQLRRRTYLSAEDLALAWPEYSAGGRDLGLGPQHGPLTRLAFPIILRAQPLGLFGLAVLGIVGACTGIGTGSVLIPVLCAVLLVATCTLGLALAGLHGWADTPTEERPSGGADVAAQGGDSRR